MPWLEGDAMAWRRSMPWLESDAVAWRRLMPLLGGDRCRGLGPVSVVAWRLSMP